METVALVKGRSSRLSCMAAFPGRLVVTVRELLDEVFSMAPEGSEDGNLYPDQSGDAHPQVVLDVHLCRYLARVIREVYEWWRNEVIIPCSLKRNKLPFIVFVRALKRSQVLLKECCDLDTWARVAALPGSGNEAVVLDILHDLRFSQAWAEILKNSSPLSNPLDVNDPLASRDRDAVRERRSWDRNRITNLLSNSSTASQAVPLSQDLRKKLKISSNRTDKPSSSSTTISRSDSCEISQKISLFAINNKLRDGEHLGAGAYGAVCATEWQGLQCAMKIFNSVENDESFKREAAILGDLRHPNVVQLYGFTRGKSKPRIILELMRTDLRALLDSLKKYSTHHPFRLPIALDIIFQIAKGLRYLHDRGIAHRDVKCSNTLISPSSLPYLARKGYIEVKLADFGLAKAKLTSSTSAPQTKNVGTTPWRAPELFAVHRDCYVDDEGKSKLRSYPKKADIYSFGITCSEILTGLRPFQNGNQSDMYARITRGERPSLVPLSSTFPAIPMLFSPYHKNKQTVRRRLNLLIKRCWDTDPECRPSSAEVCDELKSIITTLH